MTTSGQGDKVLRFGLPSVPNDGAELDFGLVQYRSHREGDFILSLCGNGFDASRYLNRDEAEAMRDWLVSALAQSGDKS